VFGVKRFSQPWAFFWYQTLLYHKIFLTKPTN
jgi:hypothetical protein